MVEPKTAICLAVHGLYGALAPILSPVL